MKRRLAALGRLFSRTRPEPASPPLPALRVRRLPGNPVIRPDMLPGGDGDNINGPSLIRVPDWLPNPLGRYYLYFAHHKGRYIRLAYADDLAGPWRIHEGGSLQIEDTPCTPAPARGVAHIASPDVHVDAANRTIRLYFHGLYAVGRRKQTSFVALSADGVHFHTLAEPLGNPYFRVFRHGAYWYAIAPPGVLYRSRDGLTGFEQGATIIDDRMRHPAISVTGDVASVYYTRVGDAPERIVVADVAVSGDWSGWRQVGPRAELKPEAAYEGAALRIAPSVRGGVFAPVRQLRDPAVFQDGARSYLLYSIAGEQGIAIAELL